MLVVGEPDVLSVVDDTPRHDAFEYFAESGSECNAMVVGWSLRSRHFWNRHDIRIFPLVRYYSSKDRQREEVLDDVDELKSGSQTLDGSSSVLCAFLLSSFFS